MRRPLLVLLTALAALAVLLTLAPPEAEAQGVAPTITNIVPANNQLTVHWTIVDDPFIDGFKVQWKSGGQGYSAAERQINRGKYDRSATITGLNNGTRYTVRVFVFFDLLGPDGESAEQTAVAGVPPAAPV